MGLDKLEATIEASKLRLRPISEMTTFATVFGALPLAFSSGAGSEAASNRMGNSGRNVFRNYSNADNNTRFLFYDS